MKRKQLNLLSSLAASLWLAVSAGAQTNGVLREVWWNIGGSAVADLTNNAAFPASPSFDEVITNGFEAPVNVYDTYGQRLRALLLPPTTGNYVFFIASDDNSQLFLSTNGLPAGRQLIARVDGWTDPRKYHWFSSQKSAAIPLVGGQRYYLEALMKEDGGGDNLAVAWQKPGEAEPADDSPPIPNANLVPYGIGPPVFAAHPVSTTVVEGGTASFSVQLTRSLGSSLQWVRNGTNVPGATTDSLALDQVRLADNGSSFYCRAVNAFGATNSNTAMLTVTADTTRPTISYAQNFGDPTLVTVGFSELVEPASAGEAGNYFINNGITISSATLMDDGITVQLRTSPLVAGGTYTLTVSNVRDRAQTPNTILPFSQFVFSFTSGPLPIYCLIGTNEPAGPSSRRTPLAISEIMYHPTNRPDGKNLEFIEIYNSNPWPEDLSGYRFSGSVGYTFPAGTTIPALGYRVVAANPADVQAVYGLVNVLGPLTNSTPGNATNVLDNGGGTIRLRDELNAVLLEVNYDDQPPWPAAADGAGHSLVLARPSYGEGDPRAWAASDCMGGSPGAADPWSNLATRGVLINEILAHTDPPQEDSVELFNYGSNLVDLSGCVLTDDPTTNRFRLAAGTTIGARGFLAFTATQLGFRLDAAGETIYFIASDGSRVLNAVRFPAQENGIAFGRFPDGAPDFRRLSSVTLGTNNAPPLRSDVVINEVQYHPASQDEDEEFVEIYNRGSNTVALGKWRLSGGISFVFPTNVSLAAGGYLVVARNVSTLLAAHPNLSPTLVVGAYSGKLGNGSDIVRLDKPDELVSTNQSGQLVTNKIHVVVDEVAYQTGGRWPRWADGWGSSLERKDPRGDGNWAATWANSDETAKSSWTTVEFTGVLDNGAMAAADQLQLFLLGPGECLVDNVEVIPQGGTNVVVNSTFDTGASGWFFQGTHNRSTWQASGGYSGGGLHVVASDRGDPGANRIRTVLGQTLAEGTVATLRAKVRWLKGHPEILLRLHGNWLEATGTTVTTHDFGSPGVRNTQFQTNSGPAISDVRPWPVLPAAGQAVTVTARIEDPDGIGQALLRYRVDPSSTYVTVVMNYRGAGYFSAVIPGQAAGVRAAFYLEARDAAAPNATSRFPDDAPARECMVGFGESIPVSPLAAYRLWVSQRNVTRWATREKQSSEGIDVTFVYNGCRVCYNASALYSGSPFHTPGYNSPDGNACDYEMNFSKDDLMLGTGDFVLATIGNFNSDPTYQAEQTAFWISRKLGAPYLNRRYFRLFFNGQQRSEVYEDAQQPNADVVSEFFPDDDAGNLHKIEDWFEFNDTGDNMLGNVDATLQNFTTTGGVKKTARYRWNWRPRATRESANAFTNLFALVDAMNATQPDPYGSWVAGLVNVEEFMRVLAIERMVGNWDSYGYSRGKNMFIYKPTAGSWTLLPWDIDFVFSAGGRGTTDPLFGSNEPVIDSFRAFPEFQRAYWRTFEDAVNGPLQPAALAARLDPRYAALAAAGVPLDSPQALKDYAAQRRNYILSQLATVASPFTVNPSVTLSNGLGLISGTAPVGVATVTINGAAWTVRWTSVSNWVATVPLQTGSNFFGIVGLDDRGQTIVGASNGVALTYASAVPSPVGAVVINELMFNPVLPDAEYVELFNTSFTNAFDLSGWVFNGLDYTFPNGTSIAPRAFLVLAKNRAAFGACYGSGILVFDEYSGHLQANGETLSLLKPTAPAGTFIVVDRVRYEAAAPWPTAAPGAALQLRDPAQDNVRVANWAVGNMSGLPALSLPLVAYTNVWRFMQVSNLDRLSWTVPAFSDASWPAGPGLLAYENNPAITPLIGTNLNPPALATNNVGSGHAYYFRTRVVVTNDLTGSTLNASAYVDDGAVFYVNGVEAKRIRMADGVVITNLSMATGQPPGGDATSPDLFTLDAALFVPGTNLIAVEVHQNQTNSSDITFGLQLTADRAASSNSIALATPGTTNSVLAALPAFPTVWLNEAQADNLSGPTDNAGQREPWVELFNPGTSALSLGGYFLSRSYTNLSQWAFPSNVTVPAGGFTLVWCDGETNQTAAGAPHANFRLASGAGQVALSRALSNTVQLVDYLTYTNLPANWSYGDLPDAQPCYRGAMFQFTPGATNNGASPPLNVFINEWMADNARTEADPADSKFQDWFEIYNPGATTADLGGYYLTDNLTNKFQFLVPNNGHYQIPPGGFLLVWADNESGQNSTNRADLHVEFALNKGGEAIGIFAADGTLIDAVTFGPQATDVSEGRFPDGAANIVSMTIPTPRAANRLPNTPPSLAPIQDQEVTRGQTLAFTVTASDTNVPAQLLFFSLGGGAPPGATIQPTTGLFSWTPATAPSTNLVTVIVTDDGTPSLSATQTFRVTVFLPPTVAVKIFGDQMQLTWPRGTLQEADDVAGPYRDVTDSSPLTVDLSESRKFYRVRL